MPVQGPLSQPTRQLEDQALRLLFLATDGLSGGWARLDWTECQRLDSVAECFGGEDR